MKFVTSVSSVTRALGHFASIMFTLSTSVSRVLACCLHSSEASLYAMPSCSGGSAATIVSAWSSTLEASVMASRVESALSRAMLKNP